jgi:hypothetical protein
MKAAVVFRLVLIRKRERSTTSTSNLRILEQSEIAPKLRLNTTLSVCDRVKLVDKRYQQRESAAKLNYDCSLFYKLPVESPLIIAQDLYGPDLLSYAYCSQRTSFLVNGHTFGLCTETSVFNTRLSRDRSHRLANLKGTRGFVRCVHHKRLHHTALFAPPQLHRSTQEDNPLCTSAFGRYRICEHLSLSAKQLLFKAPLSDETQYTRCHQHVKKGGITCKQNPSRREDAAIL